jgi:hypothetical protein
MPKIGLASLIVVMSLCLAPAGALAKSPPNGNYGCSYSTFSGTFYAGTLNIKSKTTYKVNNKKKGEYTTRRKRINFKTGDYKRLYYGKWSRVKNVLNDGYSHKIELFGKKDDEQKLTCTKSGR